MKTESFPEGFPLRVEHGPPQMHLRPGVQSQHNDVAVQQARVLAAYLVGQAQVAEMKQRGYNLGLALAAQAAETMKHQSSRNRPPQSLVPGARIAKPNHSKDVHNMVTWRNKSKWRKYGEKKLFKKDEVNSRYVNILTSTTRTLQTCALTTQAL